jgi:serum/glucocorticoid-regulated kinase 2
MAQPGSVDSDGSKSGQPQVIKEEDDRQLIWEAAPGGFHIYDPATKTREPIRPRLAIPKYDARRGVETAATGVSKHEGDDPAVPSQSQKHDVLEAALQAGYDGVVRQLLEEHGGMNLNIVISTGDPLRPTRASPLELVTGQENVSLVRLFLAHGADANYSSSNVHRGGPALIQAVEKGNQTLAKLVVGTTGRVASTRALGLAVDRQDAAMVALLLSEGGGSVRCDFDVADRPDPRHPDEIEFQPFDESEPDEFVPPLVRAVKHCNPHLVRLLLTHGADANVGYHDLCFGGDIWEHKEADGLLLWPHEPKDAARFSCGRVVELAMAMRQPELVRLLLAAGADIGLAHPVWNVKGHERRCALARRDVYQRVTAGLRAALKAYNDEKKGSGSSESG